jgi:hypothetical protein
MKLEAFVTWTDQERALVQGGFSWWGLLFPVHPSKPPSDEPIELINVTLGTTETLTRLDVLRLHEALTLPDARLSEATLHRAGLVMAMINAARSDEVTGVALAMIFGAEVVVQQCNQLVAMHSTPSLMSQYERN